jgi:tetrahydromethanopterin S-methyltransferase subunit B
MVVEQGDDVPAGEYVALYDGEGTLTFDFDATVVSEEEAGRVVLDVQPSGERIGGIHMVITETNPDDYIRNVRVIMPGFEEMYEMSPSIQRTWNGSSNSARFGSWIGAR